MLNKKYNYLIWLIFFLSIYLRIVAINHPLDLWHDASFSVLFSQEPILYILNSNDVHPPLYYLILKPLLLISTNEIFLRMTTVITWCFFFWVLYNFLKKNFRISITNITLLLFSCSPTMIFYSIELRNYMLGMVFVTAQIYYFFYNKKTRTDNLLDWKFIMFSCLMLYTHYFTAFVLFVEFIYLLYLKNYDSIRNFVVCFKWILILCIPLLVYFINTIPKLHSMWFKDITLLSFFSTISYQFVLSEGSEGLISYFLILMIIFLPFIFYFYCQKKKYGFYLLLIFIPVILVWSISQFNPIYHHRFFLFYSFALYIIIATTIDFLIKNKKLYFKVIGLMFLIIFPNILLIIQANTSTNYPNEIYECQKFLKDNYINKNDKYTFIHISPFSQTPFKYYFRDYNVINLLKTNLTKKHRFTAGGSVIKDWEIINEIKKGDILITESSKYDQGNIIYNKGGLIVYEKN